MAPTDQNPFSGMSEGSGGSRRGDPSVPAEDLAASAARAAVRGDEGGTGPETNTASPGTRFDRTAQPGGDRGDEPLESESSQHAEFEDQDVEREPWEADEAEAREAEEAEGAEPEPRRAGDFTDEEIAQLEEMGIDLPMEPSEVPEQFRPVYNEMAQRLVDAHADAQAEVLQAQQQAVEMVEQVKGFAERLQTEEGQQRLLLSVALQSPENFESVVETVHRMAEDPEYKENVLRRLEAEVKMEAAERKERAVNQTQARSKAQKVEGRTERLANRYGIDSDFAKEQVAQRILLNEAQNGRRDITLREVDEVMRSLARRMGTRKRRTKRPDSRQRESQAPSKPARKAGREQTGDESGQSNEGRIRHREQGGNTDVMDRLRGAVRTAAKNARNKGL